jgi:hypothetical protein
MIVSEEARQAYYDRQKLHMGLQLDAESQAQTGNAAAVPSGKRAKSGWKIDGLIVAGLLALLLLVGVIGWQLGQDSQTVPEEPVATGFGVVAAESDANWGGEKALGKGDLLPIGNLKLNSGLVQLELFSGVVVLVEGEADFEVVSPEEILVTRGSIRAQVPELARGFRVRLASGGMFERGTDFAMEVTPEFSDFHVIDGNAEWHPGEATVREVAAGNSLRWDRKAGQEIAGSEFDRKVLARLGAFEKTMTDQRANRLKNWQDHSQGLRKDSRLLVYYPIEQPNSPDRQLIDESAMGIDGTVVRAEQAMDRWERPFGGLDFSPMGSRVRLTVPGEHRSLTLMCWVKIDSLDRLYNSLFLTDGHELYEPHWQIMRDGRLFFSVRARDEKGKSDKHIAFSPPIWTPAQSGQWMHLATIYDGEAQTTTHYVDGEAVSIDQIPEDLKPEKVTIGAASIGNWSEPRYRQDAEFAVRNLNGSMDEFALFSAALTAAEILEIFEVGKP